MQQKQEESPKKPADVVAYLGKYDLLDFLERNTYSAYPTQFFLHPDWKISEKRYDADLAIIFIEDKIPIRSNIFPACLWFVILYNLIKYMLLVLIK